jgi:hypothetical protein
MSPWGIEEHRETFRAAVIRGVLQHREQLLRLDPWLPFPQTACCFTFGRDDRPIPVGALFVLWDRWAEFTGPCPECGSAGYGFAFGGMLTVGGVVGCCTGCERHLFRQIGGLATVGRVVDAYLKGTPFFLKSGFFGGTQGSDGQELLDALASLGVSIPENIRRQS